MALRRLVSPSDVSGPVSIQTHASHATQALTLRAMRAFREKQNRFYRCVFLRKDRLRQLRDLRLRTFVFCLRNFLAFVAFLAHFLFCLRTFPYARPCVCCVCLNGNRALCSVKV